MVSVKKYGPLAQLARALPWHGRGRRFEPDRVHHTARSAAYKSRREATRFDLMEIFC